jgi:hypothetical protein
MSKDDAPVLGGASLTESFKDMFKRNPGDGSHVSKIDFNQLLDLGGRFKKENFLEKNFYEKIDFRNDYQLEKFPRYKGANISAFKKIIDDVDLQDLVLSPAERKKRLEDSRVKARLHVRAGCPIDGNVDVAGVVVGKRQTLKI